MKIYKGYGSSLDMVEPEVVDSQIVIRVGNTVYRLEGDDDTGHLRIMGVSPFGGCLMAKGESGNVLLLKVDREF